MHPNHSYSILSLSWTQQRGLSLKLEIRTCHSTSLSCIVSKFQQELNFDLCMLICHCHNGTVAQYLSEIIHPVDSCDTCYCLRSVHRQHSTVHSCDMSLHTRRQFISGSCSHSVELSDCMTQKCHIISIQRVLPAQWQSYLLLVLNCTTGTMFLFVLIWQPTVRWSCSIRPRQNTTL